MPWLDSLLDAAARSRGGTSSTSRSSSIVVYEVLKLIRGTRASQMAVAIGAIVGLFYASRALEPRDRQLADPQRRRLRGVRGDRAAADRHPPRAGALRPRPVLQVPAARRGRRRRRSRSWSSRSRRWPAKQIGALVVVERGIGLRNHIESGIPLDATLTYDLLVSIFQPTSPLHDGAVIVQGDRIAAAACFLPLSVNPRLTRELGSRHRAALGVTEENDAVALVVSEETGAISLVLDGTHRARPDRRRAARPPPRPREADAAPRRSAASPRRRWTDGALPVRHVGLKLLSVAVADLLWLVVTGDPVVERTLRVGPRTAARARRPRTGGRRARHGGGARARAGQPSCRAWARPTSRWSSISTASGPAAGCSR